MDAWPTFWRHNKPLYERHIAAGYRFKHGDKTAHFVDGNGEYATYPVGYITGVGYNDNGTPTPYYASVYLGESGWAQRSYKTRQECVDWAFEYAAEVLAKQTDDQTPA